jgi:predicted TIM-barrel fold metal-dependent hydrolase
LSYNRPVLVDGHVHIWSADTTRYPPEPSHERPPKIDGSAEMLLRTLTHNGVDAAIVVQPRVYGGDHAYLLDALAKYGDRLVAVAALDPRVAGAVAALRRLVAAGIRGLRLDPHGWGVGALIDGTVLPLWDRAADSSIAIELLVLPDQLASLEPLVARTQHVQVVVEHAARYGARLDDSIDSLLALADWPNVTVKVSALASISGKPPPYRDLWGMIGRLVEVFGAERLMWGSDMPWIGPEGYAAELDAAASLPFFDDDGREWLLGGTATRVFGLA